MDVAPNQTLYLSNLYDKLKREETKKCIYALFGQFGRIADVVCMNTEHLRGQAWVAYADITAATNALRAMQDFPFFDKPMRVQFARGKSDAIARLDGSWKISKKRAAPGGDFAGKPSAALGAADASTGATTLPAAELGSPNRILFVENLPPATNEAMLSVLFKQYPGFQQVRMVPAKPGIAFVDFSTEMQASTAVAGLQGFKVTPQHALQIIYAKQ